MIVQSIIKKILTTAFHLLPDTRCFQTKSFLLRKMGYQVGLNVRVCSSVNFLTSGSVRIDDGTWIGHEFLLIGGVAAVNIGRNCDIAPRVTLATGSHEILIGQERIAGPGFSTDITIGDGCWIGTNSTVLGGTKIGKCSIVAAGSVVKGDFPARSLIGGVPAKLIRTLP